MRTAGNHSNPGPDTAQSRLPLRVLVLDPPAADAADVVRHARARALPPATPLAAGGGAAGVGLLAAHGHAEEDRGEEQAEPGGPAEAEGPLADLGRAVGAVEGVAGDDKGCAAGC